MKRLNCPNRGERTLMIVPSTACNSAAIMIALTITMRRAPYLTVAGGLDMTTRIREHGEHRTVRDVPKRPVLLDRSLFVLSPTGGAVRASRGREHDRLIGVRERFDRLAVEDALRAHEVDRAFPTCDDIVATALPRTFSGARAELPKRSTPSSSTIPATGTSGSRRASRRASRTRRRRRRPSPSRRAS